MNDNATSADEFGPARLILTLPVPGPRGPLKVEVEAASLEQLIPLVKGLPGAGRDTSEEAGRDVLEMTLDFLARYEDSARQIAERWVIAPRICFDGPEPGKVEWRSLHLQNRLAIINGITRFSQTGSAEEAEQLATFPAEQPGGTRNGRGVGSAGPAPNATAPNAAATSRLERV